MSASTTPSVADLIPIIQEHVVPLLDEALSTCSDRHQLGVDAGADDFSYGTDAWSFPKNLIADAIAAGTIPFVIEKGAGFGFRHGTFAIYHHRVGADLGDDIHSCFPSRGIRLQHDYSCYQLDLFDPSSAPPVALAYLANPDDGLVAVYLCTVGEVVKEQIVAWDEVHEIPLDVVLETDAQMEIDDEQPAPEVVAAPKVIFFPGGGVAQPVPDEVPNEAATKVESEASSPVVTADSDVRPPPVRVDGQPPIYAPPLDEGEQNEET